MAKKWLTFDLDGTLMQNPFVGWVFPEIDKLVKEETTFGDGVRTELISEHSRRMREGLIVEAYNWDDILKDVLLRKGLTTAIDIEELVIKHAVHPKVYLLEEGILDALQHLRNAGYSLAAVTNGYSIYQLPVLDSLQLSSLFDLVITPEKVGYGKPNNNMVKSLMNSDNRIVAHVGDRIDHDVVFANELGIPSVFIYKDMPQGLKDLDPIKRRESEQCLDYCKHKWHRETDININRFSEKHIPQIVIHSIHELADCL